MACNSAEYDLAMESVIVEFEIGRSHLWGIMNVGMRILQFCQCCMFEVNKRTSLSEIYFRI